LRDRAQDLADQLILPFVRRRPCGEHYPVSRTGLCGVLSCRVGGDAGDLLGDGIRVLARIIKNLYAN
jgi:hypothetical protein